MRHAGFWICRKRCSTLLAGIVVSIVGFVGQLVLRKDPLTFVRAVAEAQDRHPEMHAVLLGARHSTKPEALAYEALVKSEAGPAVHFLGEDADIAPLLRGMATVVCTSRQEPLSRVLLESLALARAVVATRPFILMARLRLVTAKR